MLLKLNKFPVISSSGQEYKVSIESCERGLFGVVYDINLYIEIIKTNWFTKNTCKKFKKVYGYTIADLTDKIIEKKIYGDFIKMARFTIEHYEDALDKARKEKLKYKKNLKDFIKWDGKC